MGPLPDLENVIDGMIIFAIIGIIAVVLGSISGIVFLIFWLFNHVKIV